ncbi:hypothetical protein HRD49_42840 [Corallococcus exiguus]|uniref:hypothetical protein n=1 Tax=Corallococcus exiguus TaxID=83462 RepID=UPI00156133DE|nr:hypothetical protein [Corallococcus exiguus]NRD68483.1 hypothetical protein [Corallococcus exiguus]
MSTCNTSESEAPMHVSLRERVRALARAIRDESRQLAAEGRALVLCPPGCPGARPGVEHAHTWWDMWRLREVAEYECHLRRAREGEEAQARVDVPAHLARMGVGVRHVQGLGNLDEARDTLRAVRAWLAQPRPTLPPDEHHPEARPGPMPHPWLLLMGPPDTGKTQAAVAALAAFVRAYPWGRASGGGRQALPALFLAAAEFASMDVFSQAGRERLEDVRRAQLLVLDDVGTERLGDVGLGLLHDVLDARYRDRRRTVLTTHLGRKDFLARFDGWKPFRCGVPLPGGLECDVEVEMGWRHCSKHRGPDMDAERTPPGRLERRLRESAFVLQVGGKTPSLSRAGEELWAKKGGRR